MLYALQQISFCSCGERELGAAAFEFYAGLVAGTDQRPFFCHRDRKEHKKAAAGKWHQKNAAIAPTPSCATRFKKSGKAT